MYLGKYISTPLAGEAKWKKYINVEPFYHLYYSVKSIRIRAAILQMLNTHMEVQNVQVE